MTRKDTRQLERIAGALESGGSIPSPRNTAHVSARDKKSEKLPLMGKLILALFSSDHQNQRASAARRSFPITAYVGPNGGGKTLAMVLDTIPTQHGIRWHCANPDHLHTQRGIVEGWRTILSTVPLLDGNGVPHPLYVPFTDFQQLVEAEHCDVLMDEVTGVASSRDSQRMDARVANKLVQLRRADVVLRWTAPNWARADKIMREVTQAVVECRGYFAGQPILGAAGSAGLWAPKRVFRFRTFDSIEFEEWSASKRDTLDTVNNQWFKGVGSEAFKRYDTLGAVSMVAGMTPEDTCTVCEGRITRPICKGHRDLAGELNAESRRAESVGGLVGAM